MPIREGSAWSCCLEARRLGSVHNVLELRLRLQSGLWCWCHGCVAEHCQVLTHSEAACRHAAAGRWQHTCAGDTPPTGQECSRIQTRITHVCRCQALAAHRRSTSAVKDWGPAIRCPIHECMWHTPAPSRNRLKPLQGAGGAPAQEGRRQQPGGAAPPRLHHRQHAGGGIQDSASTASCVQSVSKRPRTAARLSPLQGFSGIASEIAPRGTCCWVVDMTPW